MSEIKLDVSGMTCGSCVKHVTNALKPLDGVEDVSVDLATGKVKVTRATDKADDLIAALVEDGYPAQLDVGGAHQAKQGGGCGGGCSCSQCGIKQSKGRVRHPRPWFDSAPGHQEILKPPSGGFFISTLASHSIRCC